MFQGWVRFGFCLTCENVGEKFKLLNGKTDVLSRNCVGVSALRHLVVIMAVINQCVEIWEAKFMINSPVKAVITINYHRQFLLSTHAVGSFKKKKINNKATKKPHIPSLSKYFCNHFRFAYVQKKTSKGEYFLGLACLLCRTLKKASMTE